jgi:FKBP-type peptidyl-prolyl cis-trans isomerase FklB
VISRSRRGAAAHPISRPAARGLSLLLAAALAASSLPVIAQQGAAPAGSGGKSAKVQGARAVKEKGSYSLGVLLGAQLRQSGLTPDSIAFDKVTQGLRDVMKGTAQPSEADRQNIQELIQVVMQDRQASAGKNQAEARKFLAENAKRKGIVTTASGLQYRVLAAGSGASPRPTDEVTVNYRGTLIDGTEFDSSYKRGEPATFTVGKLIPGWNEALVLMKPGAKWQLFIPPELAYGDNVTGPIPPGSVLKFDVELLSVRPASAPPVGAAPGIPGGAR